MRKVKYISKRNIPTYSLTFEKVYDVISSYDSFIYVINDIGVLYDYYIMDFVDVTTEYRDMVIDDILL